MLAHILTCAAFVLWLVASALLGIGYVAAIYAPIGIYRDGED